MDVPIDTVDCNQDLCVGGAAMHPPAPSGTPCDDNGGSVCDAPSAACVGCLTSAQCGGGVCLLPMHVCEGGLLFSEYIEGSGAGEDALEIFNRKAAGVNFNTTPCAVRIYTSGSMGPTNTIVLQGAVASGDVFTLCNLDVNGIACDQVDDFTFNGDDAIELVCSTRVDLIGQIGVDPGAQWGTPPISTMDHTLRRKCGVFIGRTMNTMFDPSTEWDSFPVGTLSGLNVANCP